MEFGRMEFLVSYLTDENWKDVCEERAMEHICGWPLCDNSTEWTAKKASQVIQTNSHNGIKILDRSELFRYCTPAHMELSKQVEISLNKEPWWMRVRGTRDVDLSWLSILLADIFLDSQPTSSDTPAAGAFESLTIVEHMPPDDLISEFQNSTINPPVTPLHDPQALSHQLDHLEPFNYHTNDMDMSDQPPSRSQTPMNCDSSSSTAVDGSQMRQDSTICTPQSYSEDDDSDDETTNNFFNSTFPKQSLQLHISPNLSVMNMMLHWVSWKSQKFCTFPDYKPHLHSVTMHVSAQWDTEPTSSEAMVDDSRPMPAIDGVDIDFSRRKALSQFLASRLSSFAQQLPIDRVALFKTMETLISTFDLTVPLEGLKTAEWNNVALAILYAISSRHPGLENTLNENASVLQTSFHIDFPFVQELRQLFVHHG